MTAVKKRREYRARLTILDEKQVLFFWKLGLNSFDISKKLGRSVSSVYKILTKHGLKNNSRKETPHHLYNLEVTPRSE